MLAVVMLAGRRLRVELVHHGLDLAKLAAEFRRTLTSVFVDSVHASAAVLKIKRSSFLKKNTARCRFCPYLPFLHK